MVKRAGGEPARQRHQMGSRDRAAAVQCSRPDLEQAPLFVWMAGRPEASALRYGTVRGTRLYACFVQLVYLCHCLWIIGIGDDDDDYYYLLRFEGFYPQAHNPASVLIMPTQMYR